MCWPFVNTDLWDCQLLCQCAVPEGTIRWQKLPHVNICVKTEGPVSAGTGLALAKVRLMDPFFLGKTAVPLNKSVLVCGTNFTQCMHGLPEYRGTVYTILVTK